MPVGHLFHDAQVRHADGSTAGTLSQRLLEAQLQHEHHIFEQPG